MKLWCVFGVFLAPVWRLGAWFIRGALRVGPDSVMEDFSHHLEDILHRMKIEILKEHDHEVQIAKLRTKALMGAMTANHWWASKHDPKTQRMKVGAGFPCEELCYLHFHWSLAFTEVRVVI